MTFFPSAKIVIRDPVHKEKILLVQRKIQDKVFYEPAGGKVNIDPKCKKAETLEECALREAKEELGCTCTIDQYVGSYYFFWSIDPENCSICALFLGTLLSQNPLFQKNEDEDELLVTPEWVNIHDILEKKVPIDEEQVGLEKLVIKIIEKIYSDKEESLVEEW